MSHLDILRNTWAYLVFRYIFEGIFCSLTTIYISHFNIFITGFNSQNLRFNYLELFQRLIILISLKNIKTFSINQFRGFGVEFRTSRQLKLAVKNFSYVRFFFLICIHSMFNKRGTVYLNPEHLMPYFRPMESIDYIRKLKVLHTCQMHPIK